ncbi:protein-L-isoaspartate(D-aspartate) O-methyltransferase [Kistimonas asteriae]|uniref:protein-L-isoaspartate(D-aspartate) O-methyltransferase n=1 Tax=Kistimonas asteriae TaxID=517724 RepID=UPI001BAA21A0|nr:protein-L-isoaspartate(D-aspartate) O-methyltransferase [Kistimonas asteriae]
MNLAGIGMTSQRTRDRLIQRLVEQGVGDLRVLDVMRKTPRHLFVDEALSHRAYEDTALPIGRNQTLSQPYIVARMTEALLQTGAVNKVLEVGTGSGYQTAVLAQLADRVYTVERIRSLQDRARQRLRQLKLYNVMMRHADGFSGWPEEGEYDGILVTAAPAEVPQGLLRQLAVGGRMIIPVGPDGDQLLVCVTRTEAGYSEQELEPVRFVPLLSGTIE